MAKTKVVETKKVNRVYGKEKTIGDIIHNPETNLTYCRMEMGFFGYHTINLIENQEGTFDIEKQYFKDGEYKAIKMGKTFKVKNKEQEEVEGLTQTTLGLGNAWNKESLKNYTSTDDALFITTHLLKEPKELKDGYKKIGWITGRFGIEVEDK